MILKIQAGLIAILCLSISVVHLQNEFNTSSHQSLIPVLTPPGKRKQSYIHVHYQTCISSLGSLSLSLSGGVLILKVKLTTGIVLLAALQQNSTFQ